MKILSSYVGIYVILHQRYGILMKIYLLDMGKKILMTIVTKNHGWRFFLNIMNFILSY